MRIRKKSMALILSVALVITMIPASASYVFADEGSGSAKSAGGDAFSAIGIDTSVAPDGYDANSIDNPYGRDTIKVNTVSELYTVHLKCEVNSISQQIQNCGEGDKSATGEIDQAEETKVNSQIATTLYGDGSGLTTTKDALNKKLSGQGSTGDVKIKGNYVKLNSDTHEYNVDTQEYGKYKYSKYLTGLADASSELGVMSDVAAGNFDKNKEGKSAQIAMVYTKGYSAKGGAVPKIR